MKRSTYLLLLALIFSARFGYAQSNALSAPRPVLSSSDLSELSLMDKFNNFMLQTHGQFSKGQLKEFSGMGGTERYFANNWVQGGATNPYDVTISAKYEFNFDFLNHELYAQLKDTAIVVNSNFLKSFFLEKDGMPHYFVKAQSIDAKYFFESLAYDPSQKDAVQLLKLRTIKVIKTNRNDYAANFNGNYDDKLNNKVEYFILRPDNTYEKVKLNRKSLSEALVAYKDKVDKFFEKADGMNEQTAAALIAYINQK